MEPVRSISWHGRLFAWANRLFGQKPTAEPDMFSYLLTIALALIFLSFAVAVWLPLNFATLLFGVYVEPIWELDTRFHVLFLPGRIPIIAIASPVLIAYGFWRNGLANGFWTSVAPFLVTAGLACSLFGLCIAANLLRRKLQRSSAG
jgi:hypothetical protein